MTRIIAAALIALFAAALPALAQDKPELSTVRLAVGGKTALYYLPVTVTERLGYFKDAGLEVEISDFAGGSRALAALLGGSADVVTGAHDHTIQMQAKGQPIVAVTQLGQFPGFVLAVVASKAPRYHDAKSLKGMKIGVTAPGSSTQFMAQYMMVRAGLKADDASFVGIGATATAVAAVRRGEIDALVNTDPGISLMLAEDLIKVVADTRTRDGTIAVYGGVYPAAVLYATPAFIAKNPNTTQALVNAFVRGLKFIATHKPEEIAAVMPDDYALGNKPLFIQAIKASLALYSPDGRSTLAGAQTAYAVLKEFDPEVAKATIDPAATFTNAFVEKAK